MRRRRAFPAFHGSLLGPRFSRQRVFGFRNGGMRSSPPCSRPQTGAAGLPSRLQLCPSRRKEFRRCALVRPGGGESHFLLDWAARRWHYSILEEMRSRSRGRKYRPRACNIGASITARPQAPRRGRKNRLPGGRNRRQVDCMHGPGHCESHFRWRPCGRPEQAVSRTTG